MSSFKKQEYIQVHALLKETVDYMEETEKEKDLFYDSIEDLEAYQQYLELGVSPNSVHLNKKDHKKAVFTLADAITDFLDGKEQTLRP